MSASRTLEVVWTAMYIGHDQLQFPPGIGLASTNQFCHLIYVTSVFKMSSAITGVGVEGCTWSVGATFSFSKTIDLSGFPLHATVFIHCFVHL